MDKSFPKGSSRLIIPWGSITSSIGDSVILCVDRAVLLAMRNLIMTRGLWKTTYAKEYSSGGYNIPTQEEFSQFEQAILSFIEETHTMNCQDFINALKAIETAILSKTCCGSESPAKVVEGGEGVYYGQADPLSPPATYGNPGDEFPSRAAFDAHKCSFVNNLVNGLQQSLSNMSILTLAAVSAGAIVGIIFVAVPAVAVLLAISVAGLAFSIFFEMGTYISENKEDWVCELNRATDYVNAIARLDALVSKMCTDNGWTIATSLIQQMFRSMVSTDVWNRAYTNIELFPVTTPVDCSSCQETGNVLLYRGSVVTGLLDAPATGYNELRLRGVVSAEDNVLFTLISQKYDESEDPSEPFYIFGVSWESGVDALNCDGILYTEVYSNGLHLNSNNRMLAFNIRTTATPGTEIDVVIRLSLVQIPQD